MRCRERARGVFGEREGGRKVWGARETARNMWGGERRGEREREKRARDVEREGKRRGQDGALGFAALADCVLRLVDCAVFAVPEH